MEEDLSKIGEEKHEKNTKENFKLGSQNIKGFSWTKETCNLALQIS